MPGSFTLTHISMEGEFLLNQEMYKLSQSQRTIYLQQLSGRDKDMARETNTMGFYCYYPHNVSLAALEKCYNELIRRHDVTFSCGDHS